MYRTTQYSLYILKKYVKDNLIPKLWQAIFEKEEGKSENSSSWCVRQCFQKKYISSKMHRTCTIQNSTVWCMYGACTVHCMVHVMYGACNVWCVYGALGISRDFFVRCNLFAV